MSEAPTILYVAMRYRRWEGSLKVFGSISLDERPGGTRGSGFLEVYESLEDLRADHPDAEYTVIRAKEAA